MKLEIILDEYDFECGDGCCYNYGTITTVNGVELPSHNQDTETILKQVLTHLGYEVKIKTTFNGKDGSDEYTEINWGGIVQRIPIETNGNNSEKCQMLQTPPPEEISDDEIEKMADEFILKDDFHGSYELFIGACKMYRERLKSKK